MYLAATSLVNPQPHPPQNTKMLQIETLHECSWKWKLHTKRKNPFTSRVYPSTCNAFAIDIKYKEWELCNKFGHTCIIPNTQKIKSLSRDSFRKCPAAPISMCSEEQNTLHSAFEYGCCSCTCEKCLICEAIMNEWDLGFPQAADWFQIPLRLKESQRDTRARWRGRTAEGLCSFRNSVKLGLPLSLDSKSRSMVTMRGTNFTSYPYTSFVEECTTTAWETKRSGELAERSRWRMSMRMEPCITVSITRKVKTNMMRIWYTKDLLLLLLFPIIMAPPPTLPPLLLLPLLPCPLFFTPMAYPFPFPSLSPPPPPPPFPKWTAVVCGLFNGYPGTLWASPRPELPVPISPIPTFFFPHHLNCSFFCSSTHKTSNYNKTKFMKEKTKATKQANYWKEKKENPQTDRNKNKNRMEELLK